MEVLSLCSKQNAPIISLFSYLLGIYDAIHKQLPGMPEHISECGGGL